MLQLATKNDVFTKKNVTLCLISSFKAGFINSAGFLATGRFVSHITGFGTQVGIAAGHEDYFVGSELLLAIPGSFILGGVTTALIVDRKKIPPFFMVQALITILIAVVMVIGEEKENNFFLIAMLCFICGLKNSLVTRSTFGLMRVTHITGLSTDIGLNLFKMLKDPEARKINIIRIMTLISFSSGAMISAILYPEIGFKGFLLVLGISVFMTIVSLWDYQEALIRLSSDKSQSEKMRKHKSDKNSEDDDNKNIQSGKPILGQ